MYLLAAPELANGSEATVFGGLKTKDVDVVVSLDGIGPCVAISMKGTLNAFRNLTNRMEEAVGDCTNLHIAYPGLVYGFLHLLSANPAGPIPDSIKLRVHADARTGHLAAADTAISADGSVAAFIRTYHDALARLAGRRDIRNDYSRYEAIALGLVSTQDANHGEILADYPPTDSALRFEHFFATIYRQYDQRFVYGAPTLRRTTRRQFWHADSPALKDVDAQTFAARIGEPEGEGDSQS